MRPAARVKRAVPRRNPGRTTAAGSVPRRAPAARSTAYEGPRTALQKHVDFFDTDRDGAITLSETYLGLRRLGLGAVRAAAFAGVINLALGSSTSGRRSLTVATDRIQAGKHLSDTGLYDRHGRFSPARFRRLFARYDVDGDGALDGDDLAQLVADNRTDLVGHLGSKAEFALLLELAGEDRSGTRVLTRARLERFYDGSLFGRLAEEVAARRARSWATLQVAIGSGLREIY